MIRLSEKYGKPIFLSTGMCKLSDIKDALDILIKKGTPKKNIEILHCLSQYPAQEENLMVSPPISTSHPNNGSSKPH